MASNLYKVLNTVEEGRQIQVSRAKELGHNVKDTASFAELAGLISEAEKFSSTAKELPEWKRPEEWPDAYDMLRNWEKRDGLTPGAFILVKDRDTVSIPHSGSAGTSHFYSTGAKACLTSDGTWYTDMNSWTSDVTHTWDQEKDIIVTEPGREGRYRWLLFYYANSVYNSGYSIEATGMRPIEIIVGAGYPATSSFLLFDRGSGYDSLINVEILPEAKITHLGNSGCAYVYGFRDLNNLEHIDLGPVTSISNSQSNAYGINSITSPKLKRLDLSNVTSLSVGSTASRTITGLAISAPNLISFKCNADFRFTISRGLQNYEEFKIPNGKLRYAVTIENMHDFIVPEKEGIQIGGIEDTLPRNWRTQNGTRLLRGQVSTSSAAQKTTLCSGHPHITSIDLSLSDVSTSSSIITIGKNCGALREVIVGPNHSGSMDLSHIDLLKSSLLNILDNLAELSSNTVRELVLGDNIDKLTEEELQVGTNKNWTIRR